MWFSSLRFACGETKILLPLPFCYDKEKELYSPPPPSEVYVPRGENPQNTMDSPNGRSRTGFRHLGHRDVSRSLRSPASLGGGHSNAKEGKTGDRPLTVPSPLPDGRPPDGVRRSLRKREPIARPRREERKEHLRVSVPFSHDSRFSRSQATMRGAYDWHSSGACRPCCSRVDLTGTNGCPIICFPFTTMKDSNTPATKADIMGLESRLGERLDGIHDRFDNLSERMDSGFDAIIARADRVLAIVQNDKERLNDHEKRLTKLEATVGVAS